MLLRRNFDFVQADERAHEQELMEAGNADDALSSYDPYNTGVYKGVAVGLSTGEGAAIPRVAEVTCFLSSCFLCKVLITLYCCSCADRVIDRRWGNGRV